MVGRVLAARGIGPEGAGSFLEPRLRDALPDPRTCSTPTVAASRLADAVVDGEPVGIFGDYDVDGATSAALLARYLRASGSNRGRVPDRIADGYGPNAAGLGKLADQGCRLVVTLDSGTTAFAPWPGGSRAGHRDRRRSSPHGRAQLPPALAVVNPNRQDQQSPLSTWPLSGSPSC